MITFNVEVGGFKLVDRNKKKNWLKALAGLHHNKVGELNYVFLSDEELLKINVEYLDHDTYTDIITFDNSEEEGIVEGDIFLSIDRIRENAKDFGVEFESELLRVLAHGVLHLVGFKDKTEGDAETMRSKEEEAILLYKNF